MSGHVKQAKEMFEQGYSCSQAIFAAFADETGLDPETAIKISSSFGGGMGRLREVCGAVSGMFLVVGAKYGYTDPQDKLAKDEHYRLIQSLAKKFKERHGTIICRELLGREAGWDNPKSDERTRDYYNARPCKKLVVEAAMILDEYIVNRKMEENKMIKIAVASENEMVTGHFGHCTNFNIFEADNGQILKSESIPNPGHKPGFLPNYLNDLGVNVIISGGMGGGAIEIFNEKNIEVIVGAEGNALEAAQAYLQGKLVSTGSVCHEHEHHDECGN